MQKMWGCFIYFRYFVSIKQNKQSQGNADKFSAQENICLSVSQPAFASDI